MRKRYFFINYTEEDLMYELNMLIRSKLGISGYSDTFLRNLCLEGWLLHARRIIEVFRLDAVDKKWKKRWGLISEHLSHANPSNRKDPRTDKRENPKWDVESYHCELIDDLEKVADKYKSEYVHFALLIEMLKAARGVEGKRDAGSPFNNNQLQR
jgi:hypothetical protein